MTVPNILLDDGYLKTFSYDEKLSWKTTAIQEGGRYGNLALDTLAERGMLNDYADASQITAVHNFITKRAETFVQLACKRLGIPTLI